MSTFLSVPRYFESVSSLLIWSETLPSNLWFTLIFSFKINSLDTNSKDIRESCVLSETGFILLMYKIGSNVLSLLSENFNLTCSCPTKGNPSVTDLSSILSPLSTKLTLTFTVSLIILSV